MWRFVVPVVLAVLCSAEKGRLLGGAIDVDLSGDAGAQSALNFAVVEHNRARNGLYLTRPAEVISATKQLVAGYMYTFTVRMGTTPCRRNAANETCAVHADPAMAQPYQCEFKVWDRPWMSEIELKKEECT
ncbi:cystatin-like [Halichoeres trimaculatus]|uniref:cystatin-like n=1 Tax=Halichoeres trimaculatus TaxID=147232 RepID=UPI003D9E7641